ncbi:hypothetical protein BDY19DRAFT_997566 [Irpex rosettiformis]|uniref:Uncharacterized protein n=1 Tax=Irpex rosettiformis TaxID=378272 RepID=A0ACB8TRH1_9APHY|nr:hypothetical protein BDY19DRAFT_997566 [Irpex rosettiformis]
MEEVEMYDAFQPPPPSQSTLEWLSAGSMHELQPRIGVVQWQHSDTSCPALNSLRKEVMVADQLVPEPSSSGYGLKNSGFMNLPSTSSTRLSATSSTSSISNRRKDRFPRGRQLTGNNSTREPTNSMKDVLPKVINLVEGAVCGIDDREQRKQHIFEKQRKLALAERPANATRALTRTSSARQALPSNRRPLVRQMSEDVLSSQGSSPSGSRTKDKDMEWVQSLVLPKVQKDSRESRGFENSFSTEMDRSIELPAATLPISEVSPPKVPRLLNTQDLMPPPPKPVKPQIRPQQPKPKPAPAPVSALHAPSCTPTNTHNLSSSQLNKSQKLPSSSQSHRPPALGMRRANPYSSASTPFSSSQNLPSKQRGFKTPFARPPTVSQASSVSTSISSSTTATTITAKYSGNAGRGSFADLPPSPPTRAPDRVVRQRSESPSPPLLDADSSYGEISFDIDMDIVEETMKQYDEM